MAVTIKINGVDYSSDDPCSIRDALIGVRAIRAAGGQVSQIELRSPVTQERIQMTEASKAELNAEIERWDNLCQMKTTGKRSNYAAGFRYGRS